MLKFAVPALGIYLMQPLLSNIDNSFVGRTVGRAVSLKGGGGGHTFYSERLITLITISIYDTLRV
jgi:Na+-driven multidrug efflux pump